MSHEEQEVLTTKEATQANRSRLNLRVLVTSMVVLVALFLLVFFVFYGTAPQTS